MSRSRRYVVLGVGNTLMGDDGVGVRVVEDLQAAQAATAALDPRVELLDGGTLGHLLLDRISEADGIVFVDAAQFEAPAGSVRVLLGKAMDLYLQTKPSCSVHEVGLLDLLQMSALMDGQLRHRAIVGIQPAVIDWTTELSPAVAAALPGAGDAVRCVLDSWLTQEGECPR